jgi:TolB protein
MFRTVITLVTLTLFSISALAASRVAFERGDSIWIANADGSGAKRIGKGSGPDLSPDGSRLAFTTDTSTKKDIIRRIAVANLVSGKIKVFKEGIPSTNCQRAVWSPEGAYLVFEIFTDGDWHLALVNSDGSDSRYLKKTTPKGNSFWSMCWANDGQSIYAQNLNIISRIDLQGHELKQWTISSIFPNGGLSSGSKLSLSRDGKTMAIDVEMQDEEADLPDWNGPPPALWTFDLDSGKTTRLTEKGTSGWSPCWSGEHELFFCTQKRNEKNASIYKMSLADKIAHRIMQNANNPSVAPP